MLANCCAHKWTRLVFSNLFCFPLFCAYNHSCVAISVIAIYMKNKREIATTFINIWKLNIFTSRKICWIKMRTSCAIYCCGSHASGVHFSIHNLFQRKLFGAFTFYKKKIFRHSLKFHWIQRKLNTNTLF